MRETLGINQSAPDEFKVVSRPPLSVPPEFHLRPPAPGEPPRAAPSTQAQAESTLFGEKARPNDIMSLGDLRKTDVDTALDPIMSGSLDSAAESNFLSRAGAGSADPKIRELLYQDTTIESTLPPQDDASPLERWLGIGGGEPVVDPKAEAERIRTNKDEGKPVNEGEVKTVDPAKGSVIDKIF